MPDKESHFFSWLSQHPLRTMSSCRHFAHAYMWSYKSSLLFFRSSVHIDKSEKVFEITSHFFCFLYPIWTRVMLIIDTANTRKMLTFCSILPLAPFLPLVSRWASSHLSCSFYGFYLNNKQGYVVRHENMARMFYCSAAALKCVWVKNSTPEQLSGLLKK